MNTKKISGCVLLIALLGALVGCEKKQPAPDKPIGVIRPGRYTVCGVGDHSHGALIGDHLPFRSTVLIGAIAQAPAPTRVCLGECPSHPRDQELVCPKEPSDWDINAQMKEQLWMFANPTGLATVHLLRHTNSTTQQCEHELHLITITNDAAQAENARKKALQGVEEQECNKPNILTVEICTLSGNPSDVDANRFWGCLGLPHGGHAHIQD